MKGFHTALALMIGTSITATSLLPAQTGLASLAKIPDPSQEPLDSKLLDNPDNPSVITALTLNPDKFKVPIPSFWWLKENSESKLLDNWIIYPANATTVGQVDVVVNQQVWSLLDYLERYDFVNRLGAITRNTCDEKQNDIENPNYKCKGYNLRVFNKQEQPLAAYTCNYDAKSAVRCSLTLGFKKRVGLRR